MTLELPGLRERKRLATRRTIQLAVLSLIAHRSLENVTVEEISNLANISPRTFFNYFSSKEAAAIGDAPELPEQRHIDAFVAAGSHATRSLAPDAAGRNLIDDLGRLIAESIDASIDDVELAVQRRNIVRQYPHLFAMRMATMRAFEESLAAVIEQRLVADNPRLAADPDAAGSRARLVSLVAIGAMRHAWAVWADGDGKTALADRLRGSFSELGDVFAGPTTR
ncbi:MAG: TetR family transcriptional regulator [Microbacteriaceae bacterium]|nr:TetR family transcriptional regulator [Microbacteriaceae bacterium]